MFTQVLKIYLTDFHHKKKITDDLFKKILLIQENVSLFIGWYLRPQEIRINPSSQCKLPQQALSPTPFKQQYNL